MADRLDPYGGYNFRVEIDGITRAGFKSCSGLDVSQNASTYREGTDKSLGMRKLPGLVTSSDVTLARGITSDAELWQWRKKLASGTADRRNMSIILVDDAGKDVIRWNLRNCWPTKWTGPSLDATADQIAIETLVITHEGLEVDTW
ncbi:MAG TPA: phage tail protein [Roseiflexaceae bacterium]|nr:phage tail protein [Roseiflexaceae bacterium]